MNLVYNMKRLMQLIRRDRTQGVRDGVEQGESAGNRAENRFPGAKKQASLKRD